MDYRKREAKVARLEAVLFLAREPLHARRLARYANLADGTEARTLVARLNALYAQEERAFRVEEIGGGWQLRTRRKFAGWLRRLQHLPPFMRLSQPSLETLSVVALRQPVVRAEIDAIRGVNCGEVIRQLMDRDLVRVVGRSHELGRPYYYGTTKQFLAVFGLRDLSDLPRADLFRRSLDHEKSSDLTTDVVLGDGELAVTAMTRKLECELDERDPLLFAAGAAEPQVRASAEGDEDWEEEEEEDEDWDDDEEGDDEEDDDEEEEDWDDDEEDELEEEETEEAEEDEEEWEDDDEEDEWEEVDDEFESEEDDEDWEEDEEDEEDEEWEDEDEE
ncbi:MAG TPA: SMC-Scp complex subunit ScpB [Pirellulaceae bacterium]